MRITDLFIIGRSGSYSLEQQTLNATLFMFATVFFVNNVIDFFSGSPVELIIVQFLVFIFILALFILSRLKERPERIKNGFFLSMILIFPFFYFYKGGLLGSCIYIYIPVILYQLLSSKESEQKGLFILACLILLLVVLIEYFYPEFVVLARNEKLQFFNVLFNIYFNVFFIRFIISFYKKEYYKKNIRNQHSAQRYKQNKDTPKNKRKKVLYLLSLREREVSRLIVKGYSNKRIAETLFVSTGTVKNHITSIYKKVEVNSRAEFINKVDNK